jgi:hypothetical protein
MFTFIFFALAASRIESTAKKEFLAADKNLKKLPAERP